MISDIFIKGFQSHKETYLELSDGVNVLMGDTESGKSAVIKALIWLFTNRPVLGWEDYKSNWADETEVAVGLTDPPCHIGRVRNHKDNFYYIERGDEIQEYKAFGKGSPPQEVLDLLQMADVNFQTQMSLPFMLSQSSGAVGRFLNEAADLEIIDRAQSNIASVLRNEKTDLSGAESTYGILKEDIKKFDWVGQAEKDLVVLEKTDEELDLIEKRIEGLEGIIQELSSVQKELTDLYPLMEAKGEIYRLEKQRQEIEKGRARARQLKTLVLEIEDCDREIDSLSAVLKAKSEVEKVIALKDQIAKDREKYQQLYLLLDDIKATEKAIETEQKQLLVMEEEFHKSFPKICPLCDK